MFLILELKQIFSIKMYINLYVLYIYDWQLQTLCNVDPAIAVAYVPDYLIILILNISQI